MSCHIKPEQFFNLIFGYYDRYAEKIDWVLTAASESKYTTAVPSGEIWILQNVSVANDTGASTNFAIRLYVGADDYTVLVTGDAVAQYKSVFWNSSVVLKEADKVQFLVSSGAIGEQIRARAWGYKMKVA